MSNPVPPPAGSSWHRIRPLMLYLYLVAVGLTMAAIICVTLAVPAADLNRFGALMLPFSVLGILIAIPIAFRVFRRQFRRFPTDKVSAWVMGLILLALSMFGVYILCAAVCLGLSSI